MGRSAKAAVLAVSVLLILLAGYVARQTTPEPEASPTAALEQASVTVPGPAAAVVVEGALSPNTRGWSRTSTGGEEAGQTGIQPELVDAYTLAVALAPSSCHLSVSLLAAIGQVESGNLAGRSVDASHRVVPPVLGPVLDGTRFAKIPDTDDGRWDGHRVWDRALGPLQLLPASWRVVGLDMDGDGLRDPQNVYDAAGAAMVYLCDGGRDLATTEGLTEAVLAYNHSRAYLQLVLGWKTVFDAADISGLSSVPALGAWAMPPLAPEVLAPDTAAPAASGPADAVRTRQPAVAPTLSGAPATATPVTPTTPGAPTPADASTPTPDPSTPAGPGTTPVPVGTGTDEPGPGLAPGSGPGPTPTPAETPGETPGQTPDQTTGPTPDPVPVPMCTLPDGSVVPGDPDPSAPPVPTATPAQDPTVLPGAEPTVPPGPCLTPLPLVTVSPAAD